MRDRARDRREDADEHPLERASASTSAEDALLALQRSAGNQAVARRLVQRVTKSSAGEAEHRYAEVKHKGDRAALKQVIVDGANSADERLRNAAEWILQGRSRVYALTPTADSAERAKQAKRAPDRAMFGYPHPDAFDATAVPSHVLDDQAASYNREDMEDNDRVIFTPQDSGGFRTPRGGKIFIAEPSRIDAINALAAQIDTDRGGSFPPLAETLKHEVQHEADLDFTEEWVAARNSADRALASYRTEFRAYTAQGADWLDDPPRPRDVEEFGLHFRDPRQFQIFRQICKHYPLVKEAWDTQATLSDGRHFRAEVLKLRGDAESVSSNPFNSPRVAELYERVRDARTANAPDAPATTALVSLLRRFDAHDRAAVAKGRRFLADDLDPWLARVVDMLLADPQAEVEPTLAEERVRGEERHAAERAAARQQAPQADVIAKYLRSWAEVRAALKDVKTKDRTQPEGGKEAPALEDEDVKEQFGDWEHWTDVREGIGAFVNNLHPWKLDWWSILDRLPEKPPPS